MFNYLTNELTQSKQLDIKEDISAIKISTLGYLLAVGTKKGHIWLLDSKTLTPVRSEPMAYSKGAIKQIVFDSSDSYMATSDLDRCVSVYSSSDGEWEILGRYRCHTKQISQILFGTNPETNSCILFSIGKDMKLSEIDVAASSFTEGLKLTGRTSVEQLYIPTCLTMLPQDSEEQFLVVANDGHKLRLINTATKMCRKVIMAPNIDDTVDNIFEISSQSVGQSVAYNRYFVLHCGRYIALSKIPLKGYPASYMNILAAAGQVDRMVVTSDGFYCFTLVKDEPVTQYSIDVNIMEDYDVPAEEALKNLIEDNSKLYEDLKDFFAYVQIGNVHI